MHEAVSCTRQRKSSLAGLGAQDVGIEQAQIGPRLQLDADLGEYHTLEQKAEAAEPVCAPRSDEQQWNLNGCDQVAIRRHG